MRKALVKALVISFVRAGILDYWDDISRLNEVVPVKALPEPRFFGLADESVLKQKFMDAAISYCTSEKVLMIPCICKATYKNPIFLSNEKFKSVVVMAVNAKTKRVVVSYRPTVNWQNWKDNSDYSLVQLPNSPEGVKVHKGFYRYYNSTVNASTIAVRRLLSQNDYTLQLTGYSLGAAVAIISLPGWVGFLKSINDTRGIEVIAYAGPRPGNEALAEYLATFKVPITRYTNRNDAVSHLPPRSIGYVHSGHEVHEFETGLGSSYISCSDNFDEDPNCSNGTKERYSAQRHMYPFDKFVPLPPFCMD